MTQAILITENQTTGKNMEHEMEAGDIWLHGDYYMGDLEHKGDGYIVEVLGHSLS